MVRYIPLLMVLILGACGPSLTAVTNTESRSINLDGLLPEPVFDADRTLYEKWTLVPIKGDGHWELDRDEVGYFIRGEARDSASGLAMETAIDPISCPILEWEWQVESVQASADLTTRAGDDVAAALYLFFGDPGSFSLPNPVPVLRYVWAGGSHQVGEVMPNPYLPDLVRNTVVRAGKEEVGTWLTERRDMLFDYEAAFGDAPDDILWAVALFVDNDQTGEPAAARFRRARVHCE